MSDWKYSKEFKEIKTMEYKKFGNTDLKVSILGFGAASIGSRADRGKSTKALNKAFDFGINFYDTAPFYGQGESEKIIGDVFKKKRDKVFITTKVGLYPSTTLRLASKFKPIIRSTLQLLPRERSSSIQKNIQSLIRSKNAAVAEFEPDSIVKSVESSLKRLKTDYIDILLLHVTPQRHEIDQAIEKLQLLQHEGKIRYFGASPHSLEETLMWLQYSGCGLSVLQIRLNMLELKLIEDCLPLASSKGFAVIAREPFAQGKLLPHKVSNANEINFLGHSYDNRFNFLVKDDIRTISQAALKLLLQIKDISTVLCGMSTISHMEENIAALNVPELTSEEIKVIRTLNSV